MTHGLQNFCINAITFFSKGMVYLIISNKNHKLYKYN